MNITVMRALVRDILSRAGGNVADWTMQGFGFLRYRLTPNMRLHVWDSSLRVSGVSDIHDHTQWAFTSHVVSGQLVNIRYKVVETGTAAQQFEGAVIQTGIGGGLKEVIPVTYLCPDIPDIFFAGDSYHQEPDVLHRTLPADGTATIIEQQRRNCESARVFFPAGSKWVDAEPRQATYDEVVAVTRRALELFGE